MVEVTSLVSAPAVTQGWLFSVRVTNTPQVTASSLSNRAYHVQQEHAAEMAKRRLCHDNYPDGYL
jgi:hypothetical protein